MKTKIIVTGILLAGIGAACGVNNSNKPPFDVHTFDGYYYETYYYDTGRGPGRYTNDLNVHYPFLEVCGNYFGESTKFTAEIDYANGVYDDTLKFNGKVEPNLHYFNTLTVNGKDIRRKDITFAFSDPAFIIYELRSGKLVANMGYFDYHEAAKDTLTCGDVPYSEDLL